MRRTLRTCTLLAAVTLAAGACADATLPHRPLPDLPERDTSLDPAAAVVGQYIATPCDGNDHLRGSTEWALVDVFFGRRSESEPVTGPQDHHLRAVTARGGVVVHRFNVPAVRAWMPLREVPELVAREFWTSVRDVPDPRRYDLPLIAMYVSAVEDPDVDRFQRLGGQVRKRFTIIPAIFGILPDASIPELRASTRTQQVEPDGVACLM
jgi:hypothetical protein